MDFTDEIRNFDIPDDQPITKELFEAVVSISEQEERGSDVVAGKTLARVVTAVFDLERRVADLERNND